MLCHHMSLGMLLQSLHDPASNKSRFCSTASARLIPRRNSRPPCDEPWLPFSLGAAEFTALRREFHGDGIFEDKLRYGSYHRQPHTANGQSTEATISFLPSILFFACLRPSTSASCPSLGRNTPHRVPLASAKAPSAFSSCRDFLGGLSTCVRLSKSTHFSVGGLTYFIVFTVSSSSISYTVLYALNRTSRPQPPKLSTSK